MTKHILVPNNFYFMKLNKIVKRQISLFSHGQVHLTADHFFFPKPIWIVTVQHLLWIKKKKKNQKLDLKMSMHLKIVKVK